MSVLLRGNCTHEDVRRIYETRPSARIRKRHPNKSCTMVMKRPDAYKNGPRWKVLSFLDNEPSLAEAIEFGKRHGMNVGGHTRPLWDIVEALRQDLIEITDGEPKSLLAPERA